MRHLEREGSPREDSGRFLSVVDYLCELFECYAVLKHKVSELLPVVDVERKQRVFYEYRDFPVDCVCRFLFPRRHVYSRFFCVETHVGDEFRFRPVDSAFRCYGVLFAGPQVGGVVGLRSKCERGREPHDEGGHEEFIKSSDSHFKKPRFIFGSFRFVFYVNVELTSAFEGPTLFHRYVQDFSELENRLLRYPVQIADVVDLAAVNP